ncbi:MAG: magnesium/cobalt transporter CorA [Syntrophomonadaceae bacterium]|nr:magnesium/cobalt transporter CorA [Syntrophomonadaceae bacterium]
MHPVPKMSVKAGLPPGSLVYIGEQKLEEVRIRLMSYSETDWSEKELQLSKASLAGLDKSSVHWIRVEGIHDADTIGQLGRSLGIHPLVLEDILNTGQRPKIENYLDYVYMAVKTVVYDCQAGKFELEQESFILGENYVISFSEDSTAIYDPVLERIKAKAGLIRTTDADYLLYCLLDVIVDNYFVALEELGEEIDAIQDELVTNPVPATMQFVHELKTQILYLHRSIWPMREIAGLLTRRETLLVREGTELYIRDLYDHIIQVMDITETLRDILTGMLDMYLSSVSNRMNEVMKVLTIIATVFIPLTFIVGVYGMNIAMPERQWGWWYPVLWLIMLAIAGAMVVFFKRKKWW